MKTIASNSAGKVSFDIGELKALARSIKASKNLRVRVGLFPDKATRAPETPEEALFRAVMRQHGAEPEGAISNPALGAIHEFGSKKRNIPARSWLRMPILLYLRPAVEGRGRAFWKSVVSTKGLRPALKKLGIVAENVIQNAFESGGFGHWQALKPATIKAKGSTSILIDSAQFRKAVASKVVRV